MKEYLIDTQMLIWIYTKDEKISPEIKKCLSNENSIINYSTLALWEMNIKYSIGKLDLLGKTPEDLRLLAIHDGFYELPFSGDLTNTLSRLSLKKNHRDPFDRLLIWQAIRDNFTLISADKKFEQYKVDGLKLIQN